jgi:hypothetical protein
MRSHPKGNELGSLPACHGTGSGEEVVGSTANAFAYTHIEL